MNTRENRLAFAVVLLISTAAVAQDPGNRDSIIVQDAYFANSVESVYVMIYAVTDDPVAFFNIPLRFTPDGEGIVFSHASFFSPILHWDENYYDFIDSYDYLRMFGIYDLGDEDNEPINTGNERIHLWSVVFDVEPGATDQTIMINAAVDEISGQMTLGLADGVTEFHPAFRAGTVTFGESEEVPTFSQWGFIILALSTLGAVTMAAAGSRRIYGEIGD